MLPTCGDDMGLPPVPPPRFGIPVEDPLPSGASSLPPHPGPSVAEPGPSPRSHNQVAIHYHPETAMTDAAFEGVFISRLAYHTMSEAQWKMGLWSAVKAAFTGSFFVGHPFTLMLNVAEDVWHAKLSPFAAAFRDVPIQLQLVELVLKNKLEKDALSPHEIAQHRGKISCYIPDGTIALSGENCRPPAEYQIQPPRWTLLSLVTEFKVTKIKWNNGKIVVVQERINDPEQLAYVDNWDISTHKSISEATDGDNRAKVLRVDGLAKWRSCHAKTAVHLTSADQYCGTYLGLSIVGARFSRFVLGKISHKVVIFIERRNPPSDNVMTMEEYLMDNNNANDMPWSLVVNEDPLAEPTWNFPHLRTLLDFIATSMEVLAEHRATMPLNRLRPVDEVSASVRNKLEAIHNNFYAGVDSADMDRAIIESRTPTKASKPKRTSQAPTTAHDSGGGRPESDSAPVPDDDPKPSARQRPSKSQGTQGHRRSKRLSRNPKLDYRDSLQERRSGTDTHGRDHKTSSDPKSLDQVGKLISTESLGRKRPLMGSQDDDRISMVSQNHIRTSFGSKDHDPSETPSKARKTGSRYTESVQDWRTGVPPGPPTPEPLLLDTSHSEPMPSESAPSDQSPETSLKDINMTPAECTPLPLLKEHLATIPGHSPPRTRSEISSVRDESLRGHVEPTCEELVEILSRFGVMACLVSADDMTVIVNEIRSGLAARAASRS